MGTCIKRFKRFLKRKVTGCTIEGRLVARSVGSLGNLHRQERVVSRARVGAVDGEKRTGLRNAQQIKQPGQGMG